MIDELYINNEKVDTGAETGIYLTYRSNIFSDISKVVGNNSQTIRLPLTIKNKAIIEASFILTNTSSFPYSLHSATLIRDGLVIIKDASAVLLKTTPSTIEIALTWGVTDQLQSLISDSGDLVDLDISETRSWYKTQVLYDSYNYPRAYYGFAGNGNTDGEDATFHPVISVSELLSYIQSTNDVTFNFQSTPWEDEDWVVPLLQRNDVSDGNSWEIRLYTGSDLNTDNMARAWMYMDMDAINADTTFLGRFEPTFNTSYRNLYDYKTLEGDTPDTDDADYYYVELATLMPNLQLTISGEIHARVAGGSAVESYAMTCEVCVYNEETEEYESLLKLSPSYLYDSNPYDGGYRYDMVFEFTDEEVDAIVSGGTAFYIHIFSNTGNEIKAGHTLYGTITMQAKQKVLSTNTTYSIKENLPDVSQLDFIKGIMQMAGQFAFLNADGEIEFVPYSTLEDNKSIAQDWSDHLIANAYCLPNSQEYTQGDEAQHNKMLYKDADEDSSFNGEYTISNTTLDYERDAVTLPFKDYKVMVGFNRARFPIYSYEYETDSSTGTITSSLEYDGNSDCHICKREFMVEYESDNTGTYYLTNNGLTWNELLGTYYSQYVSILNNARKLTENFILTPLILKNVDLSVPIYLRQYGAFFAISEIKTKANYQAEVTLIKI